MQIRTPTELGALIKDRRMKLGLDQRSLAQRVGISRKWIIEIEKGKPGAAVGTVLRTLQALNISFQVNDNKSASSKPNSRDSYPAVDINQILKRLSKEQ